MPLAFRTDDGAIHPDQVAYVDGYPFGDRILEGVRFRVEANDGHLICTGVHEADVSYMKKFSTTRRKIWFADAVAWLEYDGDATAEDGTNVHWGEE